MILKYGWRAFRSEFLRQIPMILQMALIMLITVACVTSVRSRFRWLNAFDDLWQQEGVVLFTESLHFGDYIETARNETAMREKLHGVREILLSSRYIGADRPLMFNDSLMKRMQPDMLAGEWIISAPEDACANVMTAESGGYHAGDVIETADGKKLRIAGVFAENTKLLLLNSGAVDAGIRDYRQILAETDAVQDGSSPVFIISESEAQKVFRAEDFAPNGICMLTFEDGLSGDEQYENEQLIRKYIHGPYILWKNSDLYAASRSYCFSQAYALMPVLIGAAVLFFISMVSVSSVSAVRKLRTCMIFRICGLTWQRCVQIAAVKAMLNSFCAAAVCVLLMLVRPVTGLFENLLIESGGLQWAFCLGFVLLNVAVTLGISSAVLHGTRIRQILKEG